MVNKQEIIDKYRSYGIKFDEAMVSKAIDFAVKYHGNQTRHSGELYYHHPLQVAEIIAELKLDSDSIVAAILHDTLEDTSLTFQEIAANFSLQVAKLVDGVTKLTQGECKADRKMQAEKNFYKLLLAMNEDIRVLIIKLADCLHNMRTIDFIKSVEKRKRIATMALDIFAPLAERIGIQQIKVELQDICFRVLHYEIRESIIQRLTSIENDKEDLVEQIIVIMTQKIVSYGVNIEISGRKKTPYSTWMKMQQKKIGLDQISDLMAFRILVDNIEDCYKVLGIMHSSYKMVPSSFQDFISTPKDNGYQSLHTVLIGPLMQKVEVQIRTKEMHATAEFGIAAHWFYKQRLTDNLSKKQYDWIQELIYDNDHDSGRLLQNTKNTMSYNQVFCLTLDGNVISLPMGATTVDFAYAISVDLGNACVGAKVNGVIVPLQTKLISGDQVEIITAEHQMPLPLWKEFVVTGKAKSRIARTIKSQQYGQYAQLGRNIVNQVLKTLVDQQDESRLLELISHFFGKTQEDMFYAVGIGEISREEIVSRIKSNQGWIKNVLAVLKQYYHRWYSPQATLEQAVSIKGLTPGIAINKAKCCQALHGDKIVGIMHGRDGMTIHTANCKMLQNFAFIPERIVGLTWDENLANVLVVYRIKLILLHKKSSLAIVVSEIADSGGEINSLKVNSRSRDYYDMCFDVEVSSPEGITQIINALAAKSIVQYVEYTSS